MGVLVSASVAQKVKKGLPVPLCRRVPPRVIVPAEIAGCERRVEGRQVRGAEILLPQQPIYGAGGVPPRAAFPDLHLVYGSRV